MKTKLILGIALTLSYSIMHAQTNVPEPPTPPAVNEGEIPPPPPPPVPATKTQDDTTKLKFGNVRMLIIEEKEVAVHSDNDTMSSAPKEKKKKKTKSTWSGFYLGVNGALTYDNQLTIPSQYEYLELDYSKSVTAGINFADVTIDIIPRYFTLNSGLGIQWNRYGLKNNYSLTYDADTLTGIATPSIDYDKNVLKGTYLQIPLFFEIHTSKYHKKAFHLGFGVIGGYKIGSRLKQKYTVDGKDYKDVTKGHFHLNPFQAYATARIGYGNINLFMNYGLTRIFEKGKGPQLYPVTVGIYLPM